MTEGEARERVKALLASSSREALLEQFVDKVVDENSRQNLISPKTVASIWTRHVLDSLQLLQHAPASGGTWLDIGTGAGFPGMAVAIARDAPTILCEPRRRRADFLQEVARALGVDNRVEIVQRKAGAVEGAFDIISARAVAPLADLLGAAYHLSKSTTSWLLPKGRSGREEVALAQQSWHGVFHVEPSLTDPEAVIVVARGIRPR